MIKLLGLLFTFLLAHGSETTYLLPDEQSRFIHDLASRIKHTHAKTIVFSASLKHPELKKALLQSARSGTPILLMITNLEGDPLYMTQYANVTLMHYQSRPVQGSVVLVDGEVGCMSGGTLVNTELSQDTQFARCSDNPVVLRSYRIFLERLIQRSHPYLQ